MKQYLVLRRPTTEPDRVAAWLNEQYTAGWRLVHVDSSDSVGPTSLYIFDRADWAP